MASNVLHCPICSSASLSLKLYVSHLRLIHSKDPSFNIMCGVDGCREVFRAFSAFNSHIYRHHREAIGVAKKKECSDVNQSLDSVESERSSFIDVDTVDMVPEFCSAIAAVDYPSQTVSTSQVRIILDSDQTAAKFLLRLREGHQVSQVAPSDVISG